MSAAAAPDQMPFAAMEARSVEELPKDAGWQFEPKWHGFRCMAVKQGDAVALFGKSGKPLGRYFPDMVALLAALPAGDRGGSVCLNSVGAVAKWLPASVGLPSGLMTAH